MRMNGKENGLTPLLAGKQHSVIQDSLPQRNSPKLIIRGASSTAAPVQTAIPQPPVDFGEQKDDLPF